MSNEFDNIFDESTPKTATTPSTPTPQKSAKQPFDKDAWAAKKRAERESTFAMSDDMAGKVAADPATFQRYLDTQSRFDRYTATNALLVMAQKPDAVRLGDLDYWKKAQIYIKKDELQNPVFIIEPGKEYTRDDGSAGTSFNVKRVYDVSQAQKEVAPRTVKYSDRKVMFALKSASPVPIKVIEKLPDNRVAQYDGKTKCIQLRTDGVSASNIIRSLTKEIAMAELCKNEAPQNADFKAYAASYAVCKKYGVDVSSYKFEKSPTVFVDKEPQEVRGELSQIRNVVAEVAGRMNKALEQARNEKKKDEAR